MTASEFNEADGTKGLRLSGVHGGDDPHNVESAGA